MVEVRELTKKDRKIAREIEGALNLEDTTSRNNHDKSFFLLGALQHGLKMSVKRKEGES